MTQESISQYIERTLYDIADEFNIPKQIIPQVSQLIEQFPDSEARNSKNELKGALAKIIEDIRRQGAL